MLSPSLLLAALDPAEFDPLKNPPKGSNPQIFGTDVTVVLGILLAATAILFFWAFFIRKKPSHARGSLVVQRADKKGRESHPSSSRRKRRHRAEHPTSWGRNPTLSETGGLPPQRPEEPDSPATRQ
jgi:hypothetical protein